MGAGDQKKANEIFSLLTYTAVLGGIALTILSIAFMRPAAKLLGGQGQMLEDAVLYARILLLALPFNILQFLFQSFFVTAEKPKLGLYVTIASGVTSAELMYRAALGLFQAVRFVGKIAIVCGSGNNGGDGVVAASVLAEKLPAAFPEITVICAKTHGDCMKFY